MPKLRLTVRDLFFFVTLAAVLVAWWVDHRALSSHRGWWDAKEVQVMEMKKMLERDGYQVQLIEDGVVITTPDGVAYETTQRSYRRR